MDFDNFYTPKDKLTTRYGNATEKFETLPASLYLQRHAVRRLELGPVS